MEALINRQEERIAKIEGFITKTSESIERFSVQLNRIEARLDALEAQRQAPRSEPTFISRNADSWLRATLLLGALSETPTVFFEEGAEATRHVKMYLKKWGGIWRSVGAWSREPAYSAPKPWVPDWMSHHESFVGLVLGSPSTETYVDKVLMLDRISRMVLLWLEGHRSPGDRIRLRRDLERRVMGLVDRATDR
jgi:uncharacterized coiled-coil protein SlyX